MFTDKQKELFWSHVDVKGVDECWNWNMAIDKFGYGKTQILRKYYISHRLAYQIFHNEALDSCVHLLHSCDNPKCCNPNHLSKGGLMENMRDRSERGRVNRHHYPKKLSLEIAREIRAMCASGAPKLAVGRKYGISAQSVREIVSNQYWKEPK